MSKEVKKAISLLEEKELQNSELIAKAEADLNDTNAKLEDLRARLNSADSADVYKDLLHEIRDNEAVLSFCEKRLKTLKVPVLTKDEYNSILEEITRAFSDIKAEYFKQVKPEIDKIMKILNAYDNDVAELNTALFKINSTQKGINGSDLDPREMVTARTDPRDPYRCFVDAYYRLKSNQVMLSVYNN